MLEDALQACSRRTSETVLTWWARLDSIFAEFELIGAGKTDEEKKAKAMFLIGDDLATLAELLGAGDNTYLQFQTAMLKRDRERRLYGVVRDQDLQMQLRQDLYLPEIYHTLIQQLPYN